MTRKIQYHIGLEDDGKTIGSFLKEKEYSRTIVIELKKTKTGIRKNGNWATVNEKLKGGDFLYNEENQMLSRQTLHAWQISFRHPISGQEMKIKAPFPKDMVEILEKGGVETSRLHLD